MTQEFNDADTSFFEERCASAKRAIQQLQSDLDEITEDGMYDLQRMLEAGEQADFKWLADRIEDVSRIAWESSLEILSLAFGSDAVEFVLKVLKHERKGN